MPSDSESEKVGAESDHLVLDPLAHLLPHSGKAERVEHVAVWVVRLGIVRSQFKYTYSRGRSKMKQTSSWCSARTGIPTSVPAGTIDPSENVKSFTTCRITPTCGK
jgi:hypothetical protein